MKYVNGKKSNYFGDFLDARVTTENQNKSEKLRTQKEVGKKINLLSRNYVKLAEYLIKRGLLY